MKKREAIEAVRRFLTERVRSGATTVGFLTAPGSETEALPPAPERKPELEFCGWQFFTITAAFEGELNDGGDATLRAPDGTSVGLVWAASGTLSYHFDFNSLPNPMLYVEVPAPVSEWGELRPHLESLAPALERDLREHMATK